jgi:hypothetical protein
MVSAVAANSRLEGVLAWMPPAELLLRIGKIPLACSWLDL